jgi:hypothetical protein
MLSIFQYAFGCHHSQMSRVFTIKKRTYQVCIECGREFEYSWTQMQILQPPVDGKAYTPLHNARHAQRPVIRSRYGASRGI